MNDHSYRNMNQWMFRGMLVYVLLSFLTPILMYQFRDNNRLIVIDGRNTYHITKYASQEQLVQLYEYTARLATDAFLMRAGSRRTVRRDVHRSGAADGVGSDQAGRGYLQSAGCPPESRDSRNQGAGGRQPDFLSENIGTADSQPPGCRYSG